MSICKYKIFHLVFSFRVWFSKGLPYSFFFFKIIIMQKIVITKKDGYSIFGSVNPRTKKLCNFSVKGNNVNENATYTFLSEAESLINHLLKNKK